MENYIRGEHCSIKDYITTFDKYTNKLKVHKITYPDDIKGFKLLKGANLQPSEEKLIRATITDITYEHVLKKLKDIYGDDKPVKSFNIKAENTLITTCAETPPDDDRYNDYFDHEEEEEVGETYYTTKPRRGSFRQQNTRPGFTTYNRRGETSSQQYKTRYQGSSASNWRTPRSPTPNTGPINRSLGRNPPTRNGTTSTCRICQSINHWEKDCPDKDIAEVSLVVDGVVLHANSGTALKSLVSETWGSLVLDCGASSTVCGQTWLDEFKSSLNAADRAKISYSESTKPFRFGDGNIVRSNTRATIPAYIGEKQVFINTDVVNADIPLLFSNTALKKGNMGVNFGDDSINAFGQKLPLQITSNGLYSLPITRSSQLINNLADKEDKSVILAVNEGKSDNAIATKLHRCFAHPSAERLLRLVNHAGERWSQNANLKQEISKVTEACEVCKVFKKPPPRPVVALPQASEFQETVAMDLKQYQSKQILHLIDACTRLSAATFIPNKKRDTIVTAILRVWISVYGSPQQILTDNGGEFANAEFIHFCEQFGITIRTTAAESPWSNGIVERANQTLARSMDRIIFDTGCDPELALLWSVNAKNSLQNVAGFSPFQLVLGRNPSLPSVITDELPAITHGSLSNLMKDTLNTIHAARTAFIACENDEKIRRALKANVRTAGETKYVTGDEVLYKRDSSTEWHGPGTVIGQTGQQVFVKHGSFYIRVHPCRLQLTKEASRTTTNLPHLMNESQNSQIGVPDHTTVEETGTSPQDESHSQPEDQADTFPQNLESQPVEQTGTSTEDTGDSQQDNQATGTMGQAINDLATSVEDPPAQKANTNQLAKSSPRILVKKGMKISHTDFEGQPSYVATINSRAGRATGVNRNWWNTTREDGSQHAVNLDEVYEWHIVDENSPDQNTPDDIPQENVIDDTLLATNKTREHEAKLKELDQWKTMGVYEEVEDTGQDCISLRWVVKDKIDENGLTICKARLCVRGYEEEQDFRTDSPTCSREGIRLFLATAASHKWKIHSMDVKGAFLQGKKLDREVLIRPPKEAACSKLWLLKKCAYGLADAPRRWYLQIRESLIEVGATASHYDNGAFMFVKSGILQGIAILHVDDIMWSGNETVISPAISKLKKMFQISHENDNAFTYVGIHTVQNSDGSITLDQTSYADSIAVIPLTAEKLKDQQPLSEIETTALRSALGQLNWLANMTRPDLAFTVSKVSGHVKHAKVADIKEINKLIKHVRETPSSVLFPALDIASAHVIVYTDSSFNNLDDGGSQGGLVVLLRDKHNCTCPISWRSNRVRRVARSTLAAEALAFADGIDTASFVSHLAVELQMTKPNTMIGVTDSRSLYDAANTSTLITDRRLRVEISAIRELKERGELTLVWTPSDKQLAEVLTKKGASSHKLLESFKQGKSEPEDATCLRQ